MKGVARVAKHILESDPEIAEMGDGSAEDDSIGNAKLEFFRYGERTLKALMGLKFGCRDCGSCCAGPESQCSGSKASCREKGEYGSLECSIYPFSVDTAYLRMNETPILLRNGTAEKIVAGDDAAYRFYLCTGFSLIMEDACDGWFGGKRTLGDVGRDVLGRIKNYSPKRITLPFLKDMAEDERFGSVVFESLRNALNKDGVDSDALLSGANSDQLSIEVAKEMTVVSQKYRPVNSLLPAFTDEKDVLMVQKMCHGFQRPPYADKMVGSGQVVGMPVTLSLNKKKKEADKKE